MTASQKLANFKAIRGWIRSCVTLDQVKICCTVVDLFSKHLSLDAENDKVSAKMVARLNQELIWQEEKIKGGYYVERQRCYDFTPY